ncbi:periplasmic heavy metal sensor [Candidatus Aerophobetes bacterium]|nr:periplasmic heavy metal sensor [Candidatus Aerophobetes bacterium]
MFDKKQKIGIILLATLIVASFVTTSTVWAWQRQEKQLYQQHQRRIQPQMQRDWRERLANYLNLTPQQKKKISRLRLSFEEETLDLRTQLERKRIQLQKLLMDERINKDKIYSLVDDMATIKGRIDKKMVDFYLKIRKILTEEQLEKLPPGRMWFMWRWRHIF